MVCDEADRHRRVLYLDTVVPRLVEYYRDSGFEQWPTADAYYDDFLRRQR